MQPTDRLPDFLILLTLIAQSEKEFRKGNWLTQEQVEREVQKRFGD